MSLWSTEYSSACYTSFWQYVHQMPLSILWVFNFCLIWHDLYDVSVQGGLLWLWPKCRFKIKWEKRNHTWKPCQLSTIRSEAASHHWKCKSNVQGSYHHLLFFELFIQYCRVNIRSFWGFRNYWSFVCWGSYCLLCSTVEKPSLPINLELHGYPRKTNEWERERERNREAT
jgi:hypothetical protein